MINWPAGMIQYISTLDLSNRIQFSKRMQKAMIDELEWKQWMEDEGLDFRKIRWLIEHNADEIPKCPICGKIVHFECGKTYCSTQCMTKSSIVKEKRKQTNIERFGVPVPYKNEEIKQKGMQTCIERYGVDNVGKSKIIQEKMKNKVRERYGVDYPMQSEEVKEKSRQSNIERLGVPYPMQSAKVREKSKETMLRKYGCEYAMQSKIVQEKIRLTCLKHWGVSHPMKCREGQALLAKSMRKNYGASFWCQSKIAGEYTRKKYLKEKLESLESHYLEMITPQSKWIKEGKALYRCKRCGTTFESRTSRSALVEYCPHCLKAGCSRKELDVLHFVQSIYKGTVIQHDRKILEGKELDIYLPDIGFAIEFNGDYWHSMHPDGYHEGKTEMCRQKGIQLMHLWEHDWDQERERMKQDIVNMINVHY